MLAPIHVVDAPKIDENEGSELVELHVLYLIRQNTLK